MRIALGEHKSPGEHADAFSVTGNGGADAGTNGGTPLPILGSTASARFPNLRR